MVKVSAMALSVLAGAAFASPPDFDIPPDLAGAMLSGRNVRLVVVGDSISNSVKGTFFPDGTDRSHFPLHTGIHNDWNPSYGWRGVAVSPAGVDSSGGYSNWRGVGAFMRYFEQGFAVSPRIDIAEYPDGGIGWTVDSAGIWSFTGYPQPANWTNRFTGYLYGANLNGSELNHHSTASRSIAHGDLHVRHVIYGSPTLQSMPKISFTRTGDSELFIDVPQFSERGWHAIDYDAAGPNSTYNPDVERYETSARFNYSYNWGTDTRHYITAGSLFYDQSSEGMICLSIAQGGDNTIDHIRTSDTYSLPGFYAFRNRGYNNDGLLSYLDAFDMTGPEMTPVVLIALGTNIASPDNGGFNESAGGVTTEAYANNVRSIIARYRDVYNARGHDPYFILLSMYDFGAGFPNNLIDTRAEWLWNIKTTDISPEKIGFISLPALMGYRWQGFQESWYFSSTDYHLSSDGSMMVAQIMRECFEASVCPADLTTTSVVGSPGYGVPNGVINNDDFFYYISAFADGNQAVADITTGAIPGEPGYGVPNGVLSNEDYFYYLAIFAAGC